MEKNIDDEQQLLARILDVKKDKNTVIVKYKKKKEKKKKKKEKGGPLIIETILYNFFLIGSIFIISLIIYTIVGPIESGKIIEERPFKLLKKGSETLSIPYINNGESKSPEQYRKILTQYYHDYPVICHHHLDMENPKYRICLMERNYLLVNPKISIVGDQTFIKDITENSISCNKENHKRRFQCVKMQWTDEFGHQLEGNICGDTAIALQMTMDEFEGNKHC